MKNTSPNARAFSGYEHVLSAVFYQLCRKNGGSVGQKRVPSSVERFYNRHNATSANCANTFVGTHLQCALVAEPMTANQRGVFRPVHADIACGRDFHLFRLLTAI